MFLYPSIHYKNMEKHSINEEIAISNKNRITASTRLNCYAY